MQVRSYEVRLQYSSSALRVCVYIAMTMAMTVQRPGGVQANKNFEHCFCKYSIGRMHRVGIYHAKESEAYCSCGICLLCYFFFVGHKHCGYYDLCILLSFCHKRGTPLSTSRHWPHVPAFFSSYCFAITFVGHLASVKILPNAFAPTVFDLGSKCRVTRTSRER